MDLLDEVVVHSNVTSLLHLRIRDPELDCHECVASVLRQHIPFFGHDIGQQAIRECKEIYGKRIAKKLYFNSNVYVLDEIKNRACK